MINQARRLTKMAASTRLSFIHIIFTCISLCAATKQSFYSFSVQNSNGNSLPLENYLGKVTLVVNVASECGFTDGHYKGLIRLKNILQSTGKFEILAFPCNQFGQQEPGSNEAIQRFVREIYHVNFPVLGKVDVLGENASPAWKYLTSSFGSVPDWNFWKYLVDENGHVVNAWGPRTAVEDIFHEVKESIDKIGYNKPQYQGHQHDDEL
ncbi:glutathione peroxidase 7-like [Mercenaria mercenaria]|uniref:glutathione peroxidase 7-like n=1 Tax=Mercenaria mercenaria TaxID=6596 RepID=UPI00234E3DA7|nr:glutathione peroxidase 7-like [Mercenaria mercenaria]